MNFAFENLLGAPYRGGTLLIHGNDLLTPVGNRVGQVNLTESVSKCLPFENLTQTRTLAVSPDGLLLMAVDTEGRALLINRKRQALLHRFSFKGPVAVARFSPDGKYLAVGVGRLLQVWLCPSLEASPNPMQLHRTYGQCHSDILDCTWSPDGNFLAVASRDITLRVFSLNPILDYEPPCLAGHKDAIVGTFFAGASARAQGMPDGSPAPVLYSLSADGALHGFTYGARARYTLDNLAAPVAKRKRQAQEAAKRELEEQQQREGRGSEKDGEQREQGVRALGDGEAGEEAERDGAGGQHEGASSSDPTFPWLAGGKWYLTQKHYLHQRGARVTSHAHHPGGALLAVGLSSGVFELLSLPGCEVLHTLSVSREAVSALAFNATGDWLAVGCARLSQLLVWEWRSETYVFKAQGHAHEVAAAAFSPDGALIATGGDDGKVKVFQQSSGFCFVTFSDHTAPITALAFLPAGHALLSASLDGSVRAWDLVRYRPFRTLTAPEPRQFACLAVDPDGEVVAAGATDDFSICVWSLRTGRLTDVLSGHTGPVSGLAFAPGTGLLLSVSWDRSLRTWDVYGGGGAGDVLEHRHDVLALAVRPDGRQAAAAALDGSIYLWDPVEGVLQGTIEGRRDIRGGRLAGDRRSASNTSSGAAFTSLAYSADGQLLVAGGASKYVCVYDAGERLLLRRVTLSSNRSLDGVLDMLNSAHMTDAGPLQLIDHDDGTADLLPANADLQAAAGMPGGAASAAAAKRPVLRCRAVALSPSGRQWAAATTEGLLLYGADGGALFDPTDLTEDITPAAAAAALASGAYLRGLTIALRLGDGPLVRHALLATPPSAVGAAAAGLPVAWVGAVLVALADLAAASPHLEFVLGWVRAVCTAHGPLLQRLQAGGAAAGPRGAGLLGGADGSLLPALRGLQKVLGRMAGEMAASAEGNLYTLQYLAAAAEAEGGSEGEAQGQE